VTWNPFFGARRKTAETPAETPLEHSLYMVTAPTPITREQAAELVRARAREKNGEDREAFKIQCIHASDRRVGQAYRIAAAALCAARAESAKGRR
jgi:hypothetical protein